MQVSLQSRPRWERFGDVSAWLSVVAVAAFLLGGFCILAGREMLYGFGKQIRKRRRKNQLLKSLRRRRRRRHDCVQVCPNIVDNPNIHQLKAPLCCAMYGCDSLPKPRAILHTLRHKLPPAILHAVSMCPGTWHCSKTMQRRVPST